MRDYQGISRCLHRLDGDLVIIRETVDLTHPGCPMVTMGQRNFGVVVRDIDLLLLQFQQLFGVAVPPVGTALP